MISYAAALLWRDLRQFRVGAAKTSQLLLLLIGTPLAIALCCQSGCG
jgi:hypothetical protein